MAGIGNRRIEITYPELDHYTEYNVQRVGLEVWHIQQS